MTNVTQQLGKYRILDKLGAGGFATVYRAEDTVLRRMVALKILHPALLTDPAFVTRFENDARAAAQLNHPHIATIYELGTQDGRMYIAIQLQAGGSLAERLMRDRAIALASVARIIEQIAAALDEAHATGFVHRDVKPSNILFNARGDAILTDFGLVKAVESSVIARSTVGGMIGTPHYMAPEIWEGKPDGPYTDIYALGCVLFEMLIGAALFNGDTPPRVMLAHFLPRRYPEPWPTDIPIEIQTILERALAREPSDRYATASALAADLQELLAQTADLLATSYTALREAMAAQDWERVLALAEQIRVRNANYRDVSALARQAAEEHKSALAHQTLPTPGQLQPAEAHAQLDTTQVAAQPPPAASAANDIDLSPSQVRRAPLPDVILQPTIPEPHVASPAAAAAAPRGQLTSAQLRSKMTSATIPVRAFWTSLILICAAWALGGVMLIFITPDGTTPWKPTWISISAAAGAITGYALRRILPALQWKHMLLIAISWTVGALASQAPAGLLLGGVVGSIVTTLMLRWAEPALRWKEILLMLVGWAVGGGIGLAILTFSETADIGVSAYVANIIRVGLLGLLFGTGGGAATLWLLRRRVSVADLASKS